MHVQIEDLSPVEKKLAVEIPWEQVRVKLERAYKDLSANVQMNGFRKGKVPRAILEKKYGRAVQQEVAKELVQESFLAAATEHKIEPVAEPVVEEAVLKPGESFKYSARIEIRGPVDLAKWEGLDALRKKVVVAEDEVDKALEHKRLQHTEFKPITDRQVTADTDVLIAIVKGKVGDFPINKDDVSVDLSEPKHEPLPGMVKALLGVPIDAKDLELTLEMPADIDQKEIAGKSAHLKVTIKDVREKVIPALDDEFAKDTGEADTLADLRAKTRTVLEKGALDHANRDMRERLMKEFVKQNPIAVATSLVERGIDSQIHRARMSLAMQGVDLDKAGVDLRGMRERLREGASEEVRGQLLLEALADQEKIEISDADVDARIADMAAAQNKRAAKMKAEMNKEGTLDTLRWRLRQEKALDLVAARATISEVDSLPEPEAPAAEAEEPAATEEPKL